MSSKFGKMQGGGQRSFSPNYDSDGATKEVDVEKEVDELSPHLQSELLPQQAKVTNIMQHRVVGETDVRASLKSNDD